MDVLKHVLAHVERHVASVSGSIEQRDKHLLYTMLSTCCTTCVPSLKAQIFKALTSQPMKKERCFNMSHYCYCNMVVWRCLSRAGTVSKSPLIAYLCKFNVVVNCGKGWLGFVADTVIVTHAACVLLC